MFFHNINPVIAELGPFEIRWYGLAWVITFLFSLFFVKKFAKQKKLKVSSEDIDNFFIWIIIAVITGARLFEVLFYNFGYYLQNPGEIIAVWHGGLSFHGGLLGALAVGYIWCRKNKVSLLSLADLFVIPVSFGLILGRIANFINGELYGRVTNVSWGVNFNKEVDSAGNYVFRHPSQLYESFKNFIIFGVLFFLKNKKFKDGILFAIFLVMYSVLRFLIEFVREPVTFVGPLTTGQFLNVIMLIGGVWLLFYLKKKKK